MSATGQPEHALAPTLTTRTIGGLRWTLAATLSVAVMQAVYTIAMSRLLTPAAFGLVAMASVTQALTSNVAELGVGPALVQKPQLTDRDVRAGFTACAVLSLLCYTGLWLAAPLVATLFNQAEVVPYIRVLSLSFVVMALGAPTRALLQREFRFDVLAHSQVGAFFVGFLVVGVGSALLGAGAWSLVAAVLAANVVGTAWKYAVVRHPLRPVGDLATYRALLSYGSRTTVTNIGEFIGTNLDTIFVGRYAGAALLGQYNRAFNIGTVALRSASESIINVLFPGFSQIQSDVARLGRIYTTGATIGAGLLLPFTAGLAVAADDLVLFALGEQWQPAAEVLGWVTLAAALNVLSQICSTVCAARAELNRRIGVQVVSVAVLALLLALAAGGPLWHYGAALAGAEVFRHVAYLALMNRAVAVPWAGLVTGYGAAAATSVVVLLAVLAAREAGRALGAPVGVVFGLEGTAGALGLLVSLRLDVVPFAALRRALLDRLGAAGVGQAGGSRASRLQRLVLGS